MWTPLVFADGTWEVITREKGVVVSEKTFKDRDLPIFRGVGYIDAHILDILAVLNDTTRATEWMHNCADAVLIKAKGDYERIVYNRTDAPWPVDDRDVVVNSTVKIDANAGTVVVRFKGISSSFRNGLSGVVRMPKLAGHYRFKVISPTRTKIEYLVDADPGGWIPDWLIASTSKNIPLNTILNLRKQVKKTQGTYKKFHGKWRPIFEDLKEMHEAGRPAEK
jgi:hypothetical protein